MPIIINGGVEPFHCFIVYCEVQQIGVINQIRLLFIFKHAPACLNMNRSLI